MGEEEHRTDGGLVLPSEREALQIKLRTASKLLLAWVNRKKMNQHGRRELLLHTKKFLGIEVNRTTQVRRERERGTRAGKAIDRAQERAASKVIRPNSGGGRIIRP